MVCDAFTAAAVKCASALCVMYASVRMCTGAIVVTNDPDERKKVLSERERERDQLGKKLTFEQITE